MKHMKHKLLACFFTLISTTFLHHKTFAVVKYDEGAVIINGVQLLQDRENPKDFYYVPDYPRLSTKADGSLEFLCLKYVGEKQESSGGLFHALVAFTLPKDIIEKLEVKLRQKVTGARIAGPVPMMQPVAEEGESVQPSFEIVSSILTNKEGKDAFTRNVISSGFAPLTPGSKAAVSALLSQQGATLLWNSLSGTTSDVSVTVHGYFEAAVKAYNAVVEAEMQTVYKHFSTFQNKQRGYTKNQIRNVVDSLMQTGGIKVDVFDRSKGLNVKVTEMESILNIVTAKLTELMFDNKGGWAEVPPLVNDLQGSDSSGRQTQNKGNVVGETIGAIAGGVLNFATSGLFGMSKPKYNDPRYITDNQFLLKDIKNIKQHKFYLNLSKSTTIKVPVHSSGNIGGIFNALGTDPKYFRIVNMNDADFQKREITFQVDGEFTDAFDNLINFVTVNFRKKYTEGHEDVTGQLMFNSKDLKEGIISKNISYPRLGIQTSDWFDYEYQLVWSLHGNTKIIREPQDENKWISTNASAISLVLPFKKASIEIDADRKTFTDLDYVSANINFATVVAGEKTIARRAILRTNDVEPTVKVFFYHDENQPVVYQTTWYGPQAEKKDELKKLEGGYVFLIPPSK